MYDLELTCGDQLVRQRPADSELPGCLGDGEQNRFRVEERRLLHTHLSARALGSQRDFVAFGGAGADVFDGDVGVLCCGSGVPRRVVVTFPLPPTARDYLAGRLGEGVELVDVRAADGQEDAVLVPSTSRQLIGKISAAFPRAVVVVVEIEDPSYGVELGGQVMRSLDAGAAGYYLARSLDQLAGVVDYALGPAQASAQGQPAELAPPQEDELSSILDRLIQPEAAPERTESPTRGLGA